MKAGIVTDLETIEIQEVSQPEPGPYEALVKVLACGFCNGTDSKILQGRWPGIDPFPIILGHEAVGRVIEVGERVRNLEEGMVVLQPRIEGVPGEGISTGWGGFVEYALATDWQAMLEDDLPLHEEFLKVQQVVPPEMDPVDAVMLISFKETYSALKHFGVPTGRPVVIAGDGPVGIFLAQFARHLGADPVIVSGHHDDRLALARQVGAGLVFNTHEVDLVDEVRAATGNGIGMLVDAVGSNRIVQQGLDLIGNGGKIGVYGYTDQREAKLDWGRAPMRWSLDYLVVPEIDQVLAAHDPLVEMITAGDLQPRDLVSHVLPLDELDGAYRLVKSREAFKVVVEMA